jgi:hypothetical protein
MYEHRGWLSTFECNGDYNVDFVTPHVAEFSAVDTNLLPGLEIPRQINYLIHEVRRWNLI